MKEEIIATSKKHWWELMKKEWLKWEEKAHPDDSMSFMDYVTEYTNYQRFGWILLKAPDCYGDDGSGYEVKPLLEPNLDISKKSELRNFKKL